MSQLPENSLKMILAENGESESHRDETSEGLSAAQK